jgi:hypothetical protein
VAPPKLVLPLSTHRISKKNAGCQSIPADEVILSGRNSDRQPLLGLLLAIDSRLL